MKYIALFIPLCIIVIMSCNYESASDSAEQEVLQSGTASWYGPGFHGRLTSNRERFNQHEFTAAHRTLPFDTIVKVINSENDKSVEVRINDRGPYEGNRIIDLSRAAADEIDLLSTGISEVELILIDAGGPIPDDLNRPTYTIQMGEYNRLSPAEKFVETIGEGVRIEQRFPRGSSQHVYMVYYGNFDSLSSARNKLEELKEKGFNGLVKQVN